MKKLMKTIAMILIGTSLFATTAFAAELDTPADEIQSLEEQTVSKIKGEILRGSSSRGEVVVPVVCKYTGTWNEGYDSWINNASFEIGRATVGGKEYRAEPDGQLWTNGSSAYQKYTIHGVSITLSVTIDEWGDATLNLRVD